MDNTEDYINNNKKSTIGSKLNYTNPFSFDRRGKLSIEDGLARRMLVPELAETMQKLKLTGALEELFKAGLIRTWSDDEFGDLGNSFNLMVSELTDNIRLREQSERALEASRDVALAAAETEMRFVSNVTHELKTPLTGIQNQRIQITISVAILGSQSPGNPFQN